MGLVAAALGLVLGGNGLTLLLVCHTFLLCLSYEQGRNAEMVADTEPKLEIGSSSFKKLGDSCLMEQDCQNIPNGTCDELSRMCICKDSHPIPDKGATCLEASKLNHSCEIDEQCTFTMAHSYCYHRTCRCKIGRPQRFKHNGTVYCFEEIHAIDPSDEIDYTMLGVLAGMALMFIVMCVVLRMFSKARFQEQRTIFNNPRLLKISLARKSREHAEAERRGSRASVASRPPSVYSGLNLPGKSPTQSQGSVDSRRSSVHSPLNRSTDQVTVDIKGGRDISGTPKTNRV